MASVIEPGDMARCKSGVYSRGRSSQRTAEGGTRHASLSQNCIGNLKISASLVQ